MLEKSLPTNFWDSNGFLQKDKVFIDGEKGSQISVVAKYIVTQGWSKHHDYEAQTSDTLYWFILLLCLYYVTDLIKKLELSLLVTFIFNKD